MSTSPDFGGGEGTKTGGQKGQQGQQSQENKDQNKGSAGARGGSRIEAIAGEHGAELRDELHRVGQFAKDAAYEQMESLRDRGMEKARQLEDRIVDQPLKSVAFAAGIGFVLGLMWMRR